MDKLMLEGKELKKGDWMTDPFEHGSIVKIDFESEEVHLYDGREGWTLSKRFNNLGNLQFIKSEQQATERKTFL